MARIVAGCVLLAALSLLGPSEPSYDPWAWLVWGREITHLTLDTTAGPSWKPLPVVFTTLFSPLSAVDDRIPPLLWVGVARTGGLLALALAFKAAARLVGGNRARQVGAGTVASVALVLTPQWIRYLVHGNEAPLAVALGLLALDRHLDGHRRSPFVLGAAVCLARPELFGFLLLYGAYLWLSVPGNRAMVAGALVLVVAAWLVPSWLGAGDPLYAGAQARSEPSWSLSLAPVPWRAALEAAQGQAWLAIELAALVALALALARRSAGGSSLPAPAQSGGVIALAGLAGVNVALQAAMTEAGFSGNVRYVLPGLAAIAVVGGVGAVLLVEIGAGLGARAAARVRAPLRAGAELGASAAAAVLLVAAAPEIGDKVGAAGSEAHDSVRRSRLHSELDRAVAGVGARYTTLFGPATVNRDFQTHMAWALSVPVSDVHGARGRGLAFRAPPRLAGRLNVLRRTWPRTRIARIGHWTVTERRPEAEHVFTWPMQGFSLRAAAARYRAEGGASAQS
jgi:hypothetical protein